MVDVGVAAVKSPKSPKPPDIDGMCVLGGGGGLASLTGAGLASKKLPPLGNAGGEVIEGCRGAAGDERLAKAAALGAGC